MLLELLNEHCVVFTSSGSLNGEANRLLEQGVSAFGCVIRLWLFVAFAHPHVQFRYHTFHVLIIGYNESGARDVIPIRNAKSEKGFIISIGTLKIVRALAREAGLILISLSRVVEWIIALQGVSQSQRHFKSALILAVDGSIESGDGVEGVGRNRAYVLAPLETTVICLQLIKVSVFFQRKHHVRIRELFSSLDSDTQDRVAYSVVLHLIAEIDPLVLFQLASCCLV